MSYITSISAIRAGCSACFTSCGGIECSARFRSGRSGDGGEHVQGSRSGTECNQITQCDKEASVAVVGCSCWEPREVLESGPPWRSWKGPHNQARRIAQTESSRHYLQWDFIIAAPPNRAGGEVFLGGVIGWSF